MTSGPPALALIGASKRYGPTVALQAIDLSVRRGEFLTLLGPSGSGKTTTLMLWAGFVEPSAGRVLIAGRDVQGTPPHRRDLGMVFQHYALFPHMTVAANVAFPLEMRRWRRSDIQRRVGDLLALMHLSGMGDRLPRQLSGGQQQRVALARALAAAPPAVLMDEPLGALDRKLREELQVEFRRLHRETDATFVYVTHDQGEALALSDRIAVMRDGRIEQVGPPAELYERPATRFVAGFLGEANFFAGRVQGHDGGVLVVEGPSGLSWRVAGTAEAGVEVVVAVRPERMRLVREPATPGANLLAGPLADRTYAGAQVRLRVEVPECGEILATLPADASSDLAPGAAVRLGWCPEAGRIVAP